MNPKYNCILGVTGHGLYFYCGDQMMKLDLQTQQCTAVFPLGKSEAFARNKGVVVTEQAVYLLQGNRLVTIDAQTDAVENVDIPITAIDLETYEILQVMGSKIYFYNPYGKMVTFDTSMATVEKLPQVTQPTSDTMISCFVNEENAYFLSFQALYRFHFATGDVSVYPIVDFSSGQPGNFAVEPTEQFMMLMKGYSSGYSINKVYLDEMKVYYESGFIDNNRFVIY